MKKNPFAEINQKIFNYAQKCDYPYTTFAIFGIITYPFYYIIWKIFESQTYDNLSLRIIATCLCLAIALHKYWPKKHQNLLPIFWYLTLLYCFPFLFTYFLLENHFNYSSTMNTSTVLVLSILILDTPMLYLLLTIGIILALLCYIINNGDFDQKINYSTAIITYLSILIFGTIFSYKRDKIKAAVAERLKIENTKHKAQLDAQTQFISTIDKVAHDSESPLGSLVTLTEYLGGIEEVSTIDGYNIALTTEQERVKDTVYLEKDDTGINFEVLGTDGSLKKGHILWEQILNKLKSHFPKNASDIAIFQKQCLAVLLDILIENKLIEAGVNEKRIPEEYRIDLREAVEKINDIMADLLLRYRPNADDASESKQLTIMSTVLTQLISEKRMAFHSKSIEIKEDFAPDSLFAFVNIQRTQVNRALSNLMNNASQAFDGNPGVVTLKLSCDNEFVYVSVCDNGKGMSAQMLEKINNKIAFTEGKKDGHGIGLGQVRDTLERNHAKMNIESEVGKGAQFTLVFSKKQPPAWAIDRIQVKPHDFVLILDDDKSIHGAWDLRFKSLSKQCPSLKFHHFFIGEELLKFLPTLSEEDKEHLLLLTDYELLNQKETGISVIEQSKIKRSILVTSHYVKREIQNKVVLLGVKLLPKKLVSHVPIVIQEDIAQPTIATKKIDAIWLDDDVSFAQGIKRTAFSGCELVYFSNPNELKEKINAYSKDTPILLDNNYEPPFSNIKGVDLAKEFHEQSFTRLYLITGEHFAAGTIPDYITVIPKSELPNVKKIVGLK